MPNIQSLRYRVEGEGDQSLFGSTRFLCMLQRSLQQFVADAAALMTRRYEQLREKPQIAADPTPGEAHDFIGVFGHPQPTGIILQRKRLKIGRTRDSHWSKAVTFRQVVDAGNHKLVGAF